MSIYDAASEGKCEAVLKKLIRLRYPERILEPYTDLPFGEIVRAWAAFAMGELESEAGPLLHRLAPQAKEKLQEKLARQISERCAPSLAALMHLARMEKQLEGKDPKERYLHFITKVLPQPKYLEEMFFYFKPMARFIAVQILLWIDQAKEFLGRLDGDWNELERFFSLKLKRVEDLSLSLSDLHHGNRSVYQVAFDTGESLIYKPKPLGLDKAYNEFIGALNGMGLDPALKTYRILDREEYGWVEFVKTLPCYTEGEVKRYFQKFGMLIAVMYLLEGTDCHYENMICSGEDPVLIDLESLFHPTLKTFKEAPELTVWNHSVFRTGFLPSFGVAAQRRMDISPLSADEEQETPQEIAQWEKVNTDEMQFVFAKKAMKMNIPRPKLGGKIAATTDYIDDLLQGFRSLYRLFLENRKQIVRLLEPLFRYPVRCIFRPTSLYFRILQRLSDPKLMRSEEETAKALEVLMRFSQIKDSPALHLIAEKEKEALLYGDIPFFLSSPKNCDIYAAEGVVAEACFREPAEGRVAEAIGKLNEKDLNRQLEYIDRSLYYLRAEDSQKTGSYRAFDPKEKAKPLQDEELIRFALDIGQKTIGLAQTLSDGSLAWIALELDPNIDRYVFQPLSSTLYSGTAGIALFFAALGKIGKEAQFLHHAELFLKKIKEPFSEDPEAVMLISNVGGFSGLGGMVYAYAAAGEILGKKQYWDDALFFARLLDKNKIEEDGSYDVILGSAGLVLSLLALYQKTKEKDVLERAKWAGEHLLKKAQPAGAGIAWPTSKGRLLTGFSHGAAGIAYALFKLAHFTSDASFSKAAEKALAYERSVYSPEKGNWPDFRENMEKGSPFSWCHGAPGIGLGRIYSNLLYPDEEKKKEIDLSLVATQRHLVAGLDHLCCGNFGRLSILFQAGRLLGRKELIEIAKRETSKLMHIYKETGSFHLFGKLPREVQSPCLMQGLSGIGYFLLQLTEAGQELPELLILDI